MDIQESERCSVHYQPFAGGTTNTMGAEVIRQDSDGTTVFKTVSDSKRLHGCIRYEPEDRSKKLSMSDKLKGGKHISPVKINGIIHWKSYFEIHIFTAGWQTSTDLGKVRLNIPGIEGMVSSTKPDGTTGIINLRDNRNVKFSAWYKQKEKTPHISVQNHPQLEFVEPIDFDKFSWFHKAYPFSGTSLGIRLGFPADLVYESLNFNGVGQEFDRFITFKEYQESRTQNGTVRL
jgi:hypothetical protein